MNCPRNPIGVEDCSHFEDAGVVCQGTYLAVAVKLAGAIDPTSYMSTEITCI